MIPQDGIGLQHIVDIHRDVRPVEGADAEVDDAGRDAEAVVWQPRRESGSERGGCRFRCQSISMSALIKPVFWVAQTRDVRAPHRRGWCGG